MDASLGHVVLGDDGMPGTFGVAAEQSHWSPLPYEFDFTSFLPPASLNEAQLSQSSIPEKTSDLPMEEESTDAKSACTRDLTSLLLDSDRLRSRLPLGSGLHASQLEAGDIFLQELSEKMATRHVLETFFVLAQRLIDVYPTAIRTSLTPDLITKSACEIPDCTHMIDLVSGLKDVEDGILHQGTFSGPDIALANLLIACHARQLDILDRVFLLVTSCTRATLASRREPDFDVSEIRIGSFVPQRTAAVLMQVALLKHLVAGLTDRLASFGKAICAWTEASTNADLENSILRLQHESLTKRHAIKITQVGTIEEFLLKFDFNRE